MKIALAQIFCPWGDRAGNLHNIESYSRQAKAEGADLVLFPELTVSGIYKNPQVKKIAETATGESVKFVCRLSRSLEITIGFGFTEKAAPLPYNTYCLIDSGGGLAALYRKNFIPKLEAPFWQAGHARPIFPAAGKRMAIAICWDATQEELLSYYGSQGAEVVLMPHAWDSDPVDREGKDLQYDTMEELVSLADRGELAGWKSHAQMKEYFYSYIPGYAARYGFTACFVNQTGQPHRCLKIVGPSFVADSRGRIIAETKNDSECLIYAEIA